MKVPRSCVSLRETQWTKIIPLEYGEQDHIYIYES